MFSKKDNESNIPTRSCVPSIISTDLNILGNLISEGYVEVGGKIEGNVTCYNCTVRKNGLIKGDVVAQSVQVDGEVRGLVKAKHVKISETGKVVGVLMYETLSIKDGAFIDGQCKSTDRIKPDIEAIEVKNEASSAVQEDKSIKLVSDNKASSKAGNAKKAKETASADV